MLIPALIIGLVSGFVSTVIVLLAWSRYSRGSADDQVYLQIE